MYCSRCGKALRDEDVFCSFCGAKVFRTDIGKEAATEEIVFNPSFEEIETAEKSADSELFFRSEPKSENKIKLAEAGSFSKTDGRGERRKEAEEKQAKHDLEFVWNLHEFPTDGPRKTEEINFDWSGNRLDGEPEKESHTHEKEATEKLTAAGKPVEAEEPAVEEIKATEDEDVVAGPDLEKEIFGDFVTSEARRQTQKIDKFYTFNKKNEEFQQLLDKEYEKIKIGRGLDPQLGGDASDLRENSIKQELEQAYGVVNSDKTEPQTDRSPLETVGFEPWAPMAEEQGLEQDAKAPEEEFNPVEHLRRAAEEREKLLILPEDGDLVDNDALMRKFDTMELARDLEEMNNAKTCISAPEMKVVEVSDPAEPEKADGEPCEAVAKPSAWIEGGGERPFSRTQALDELFGAKKEAAKSTSELNSGVVSKEPSPKLTSKEPKTEHKQETESETDAKRGGTAGKIILTLIIILLILELIILGIKIFAPDSSAAAFINEKLAVTYEWLLGEPEPVLPEPVVEEHPPQEENGENVVSSIPEQDKEKLINGQLGNNKNIASISYNASLAYNPTEDYGLDDLNCSVPLSDNIWYTADDGTIAMYDQAIVGTIIAFDSQWIDYVNNKDEKVFELLKTGSKADQNARNFSKAGLITETFEALQIGEIRKGESGFYVWAHEEIKITEKGKTTDKAYNWVYYLEPEGQQMKIVSYYGL